MMWPYESEMIICKMQSCCLSGVMLQALLTAVGVSSLKPISCSSQSSRHLDTLRLRLQRQVHHC